MITRDNLVIDLVLLAFWLAAMLIVSSIPGDILFRVQQAPRISIVRFLISDPVMHFLEYALLTFFLIRFRTNFIPGTAVLFYVIAGGIIVALCDESYQCMVSNRSFQIGDLLMDLSGIIAASSVFMSIVNARDLKANNLRK
ncbi:VanZ family protein [Candidatus Omnitrophota bacterium]